MKSIEFQRINICNGVYFLAALAMHNISECAWIFLGIFEIKFTMFFSFFETQSVKYFIYFSSFKYVISFNSFLIVRSGSV